MFADAVHPTHTVRPVGCWAPQGVQVAVEQNSGRDRLNIHGAIDLETGKTKMIEALTVDAQSAIMLFIAIMAMYPTKKLSLRDVKQDDSNNEVAPSRGGEQIDDILDGLVGAVVGDFESAVWAILRIRTAVEAAVGKWSAQPLVEEQK